MNVFKPNLNFKEELKKYFTATNIKSILVSHLKYINPTNPTTWARQNLTVVNIITVYGRFREAVLWWVKVRANQIRVELGGSTYERIRRSKG